VPKASGPVAYAKDDVRHLRASREKLTADLKEANLLHVFELEMRLTPIVAHMEAAGFHVEIGRMRDACLA
jgi:ribonuclease D